MLLFNFFLSFCIIQSISDLEAQVSILHEELQQAHAQQKQKLAETAMLLEEERQKAILDKAVSLDRLRSDMERIIHDLKRNHQQEADATHEKVSIMCEEIDEMITLFFNTYTNESHLQNIYHKESYLAHGKK